MKIKVTHRAVNCLTIRGSVELLYPKIVAECREVANELVTKLHGRAEGEIESDKAIHAEAEIDEMLEIDEELENEIEQRVDNKSKPPAKFLVSVECDYDRASEQSMLFFKLFSRESELGRYEPVTANSDDTFKVVTDAIIGKIKEINSKLP